MRKRRRLGFLGPAIVIVGFVVGGIGAWMIYKNKPEAGGVIDSIAIDDNTKVVIRAEAGGPRSFVELVQGDDVKWQAMVPPYAGAKGRVGVAWSSIAVSVRVVRDGKAEIFALARSNGTKLGGIHLAHDHDKIKVVSTGPLTFTDHMRSYEVVAGEGWNQLVAVDLKLGTSLWKKELGPAAVTGGTVEGAQVIVEQGATKRWFNVFTGKEDRSVDKVGKPWEQRPQAPPEWPAVNAGSANIK
jgi:hypothetical protein